MKKIIRSVLCIFLFVLVCTPVFASDYSSLTVTCPASDIDVRLYRVADADYNLVGAFKSYSVSQDWNILGDYIDRDKIGYDDQVQSDVDGKALFSHLTKGVYLVKALDNADYTMSVSVVYVDKDCDVELKYEPRVETTSLRVQKVWKDDDKKNRPSSIGVDLLGDGKVVDHQVLSEENHWTYAWNDLSGDMRWSCVETSVPSGYSVSSYREGNHIVLKNSLNKVVDSKKSESNLPLTGQLWWPVPVLLFVGLGCICVSKF